jgi:hypothetical protein
MHIVDMIMDSRELKCVLFMTQYSTVAHPIYSLEVIGIAQKIFSSRAMPGSSKPSRTQVYAAEVELDFQADSNGAS